MKMQLVNKVLFVTVILGFSIIVSAFKYNDDNLEVRSLFSWKSNEEKEVVN